MTEGKGREWSELMEGEGVLGLGLRLGTSLSPRRWRWASCVVFASSTRVLVHSWLVSRSCFRSTLSLGRCRASLSPHRSEWASCVVVVRSSPCVVVAFFDVVVELSLCRVVVVGSYSSHVVVVSSSRGVFVVLWHCPESQRGGFVV